MDPLAPNDRRDPRKIRATRLLILAFVACGAFLSTSHAFAAEDEAAEPAPARQVDEQIEEAHDTNDATQSRPLEPRYQPREPKDEGFYNGSYIFGMTRGVADSTIAPAGKAPLFLLTVPLDIILLPFTIIGGFFG